MTQLTRAVCAPCVCVWQYSNAWLVDLDTFRNIGKRVEGDPSSADEVEARGLGDSGEDELARRSLGRKAVMQKASDDLAPAMEETKRTAAQLREQLRELRGKLEEARNRKGTLVARHQAAEARKKLAQADRGFSPCNVCDVKGTLMGKEHFAQWQKHYGEEAETEG